MDGFLENLIDILKQAIYVVPVILISLTAHECAHAWAAYKMGDFTAKSMGRLTLNPIAHLDPMGTIMLLISSFTGFGFGWAKPVPISPVYFRNRKKGMVLSALAGPVINILLAIVAAVLMVLCMGIFGIAEVAMDQSMGKITFATVFCNYMIEFISINVGLGVFNLLPFPPLDGSKILGGFLPERAYFKLLEYENYIGILFVLIILFRSEWLDMLLDPCFTFVYDVIMRIIEPLYGLFI